LILLFYHLPDAELPAATAIPKQPRIVTIPSYSLCGCGVGFKLMMALQKKI